MLKKKTKKWDYTTTEISRVNCQPMRWREQQALRSATGLVKPFTAMEMWTNWQAMKTLGFLLSIVYFHTASTAACRLFKSHPGPWHLCESGPLLMRPSHSLGCSVLTSLEDSTQKNPAPKAPSSHDFMVGTALAPYEFHPISLNPGCFPCVRIWQLSWLLWHLLPVPTWHLEVLMLTWDLSSFPS